ncbi:MAG TPA: hypothetical protein DIT13_11065 [Verrucomicrobiales bacterium]|nr:hypothetical protein [Verrucomicrobiales bacterium]HRJ10178.1 hypothetical protein [Prosthecobacter sp.]HRK16440.1 hypothetical protein [Prosthecobacter sp.]
MPALSNDAARCEVMNLGWGPNGHGPYLVRQEGYEPGSSTFKMQRFILKRDGRWLLNLAFVMLPEAEQEAQLFHSLKDVLVLLDQLAGQPVLADAALPPGTNADEILEHFEQCTHRILRGMRDAAATPLHS